MHSGVQNTNINNNNNIPRGNDWTTIGRPPQPSLSGEVMENQQPTPIRASQSNETSRSRGDDARRRTAGRRTNRQKPHEKSETNQRILAEMFSAKQFKKYFLIKSKSGNNLADINVIKANKQLTNHLRGKPSKVTELRTGELLVEVADENQSQIIRTFLKLGTTEVEVGDMGA